MCTFIRTYVYSYVNPELKTENCLIIHIIVNADLFPQGWRLSFGDYKGPPWKGSGELSRHDLFC